MTFRLTLQFTQVKRFCKPSRRGFPTIAAREGSGSVRWASLVIVYQNSLTTDHQAILVFVFLEAA
ncbi:hypothetical protein DUE52_26200 [Larkinella punicea]|uniref:Uncharacterized protein n=1 Tax=Larkinella punicea TaxID=2315727 RepID=A0A368JHP7_9BACT|nr:hypothetical protein DUE52_26200 [Larkinella punicea]